MRVWLDAATTFPAAFLWHVEVDCNCIAAVGVREPDEALGGRELEVLEGVTTEEDSEVRLSASDSAAH